MMASAPSKSTESAARIERYEEKIREVQRAMTKLPGDNYYNDLLGIIHRPGWTSVAEGLFFEALVDTIHARSLELAELHKRLKAASMAV
ncbi:MAG: hypothetical protein ABSF70_13480 [Terracidiphilus sp.]|jgi:hypothetical protein